MNAGKVAQKISDGFGGGHDTFAAAQIPLPADGTDPADFYAILRERFLKVIRAKKSLSRPLTVPPDAYTAESEAVKKNKKNGNGQASPPEPV